MVDEETELGLVARPARWSVEGESKKQDIGRGEKCAFGKICTGKKRDHQRGLEERRDPGQQQGKGKSRRSDVACRAFHAGEFECRGHCENRREDEPANDDSRHCPSGFVVGCIHWNPPLEPCYMMTSAHLRNRLKIDVGEMQDELAIRPERCLVTYDCVREG